MPNYPYPVPEGVTITWEQDVRDDRQDACWYMESDALATVTYNDRTIYVDRNGELSVHTAEGTLIKNTNDWINAGVRNDNDLWDRDDTLEWSMNPWFDSYEKLEGDVDHLDFVEYSAYDAVSRAVEYIIGERDA